MQDDIFNPYGIDETIADYIHSCDLKKLQELKEFIERVEESKFICLLIENRKNGGKNGKKLRSTRLQKQ